MLRLVIALIVLPALLDAACCMPKKFFATRTNAKTGLRSNYVVDFDTQRVAVTPSFDPTYPVRWIINDFNSGLSYTQYKNGKCTKTKILKYFLYYRCIPSNAKLVWADYIGKNSLPTHTYAYSYGGTKIQMTVTNDGNCYPVMRRLDPAGDIVDTKAITFTNVKVLANTDQYLKRDFSKCH